MNTAIAIGLMITAFLGMEFMAWFVHRFIMHGLLWSLHRDHHQKHKGFFELNDAFVVMFAIPSWLCIMFGAMNHNTNELFIGIGIAFYGLAYFLVHEVIIHKRFGFTVKSNNPYIVAMRRAHKVHHGYIQKTPGDNFGFVFLIPWHYFRTALAEWKDSKEVDKLNPEL